MIRFDCLSSITNASYAEIYGDSVLATGASVISIIITPQITLTAVAANRNKARAAAARYTLLLMESALPNHW